eukprot:524176_1
MLSSLKLRIPTVKFLHNHSYICNQFSRLSTSNTSTEFPIIDISSFISSNHSNRTVDQHQNLVDELKDVASKIGFFYLTGFNDIVSEKLISETFSQLKLFFNLPLDEKMKIHASHTQYLRGYLGCGDQGYYGYDDTDKRLDNEYNINKQQQNITDMKEVFTMGTQLDLNHKYFNNLLFGPNIFPTDNILPQFKHTINEYYNNVLLLSNDLFQLFAIALNQNYDYFDNKIDEGMNSMNGIYYMPVNSNKESLGIGEHTDYECFTLLLQDINSPSGLEILDDYGKWKRVEPIKNTIVVNFGEMMARFSNDRFKSTIHRVVSDQFNSRYSIAFFSHLNFNVVVSNLMEDEMPKYNEIIAGEHMLSRITWK